VDTVSAGNAEGGLVFDFAKYLGSFVNKTALNCMIAEKNPEIRKAVNTLYELSADEKVRAEYEMRQKAWRDRVSRIEGAYEDGIEKGMQKGLQKGAVEVAKKLKADNIHHSQISKYTGLIAQQIREL
jgi:predicted transposase/invertase (TIGR01784 family)